MFEHLKNNSVPMMIGITFYLFGFFVMSDALKLSGREMMVGLVAGAIGGITTLLVTLRQGQAADRSASVAGFY
jgi:hypothetical protein